jgi:hypothetical protein
VLRGCSTNACAGASRPPPGATPTADRREKSQISVRTRTKTPRIGSHTDASRNRQHTRSQINSAQQLTSLPWGAAALHGATQTRFQIPDPRDTTRQGVHLLSLCPGSTSRRIVWGSSRRRSVWSPFVVGGSVQNRGGNAPRCVLFPACSLSGDRLRSFGCCVRYICFDVGRCVVILWGGPPGVHLLVILCCRFCVASAVMCAGRGCPRCFSVPEGVARPQ